MKHFDQMVEVLSKLREHNGVIAVKSEFEAEGTRLDEAMLLLQVLNASRVPLAMKIGGAEALFDLTVAVNLGVNRVVAPMVESAYALSKFLLICGRFIPRDHRPEVAIAVNIETITSVQALDEMTRVDQASDLTGVVIGRNDLAGSIGQGRGFVDSDEMYSMVHTVCAKARKVGWDTTVGGGVTGGSVPFIRRLGSGLLDRFETRKVIFETASALENDVEQAIEKAVTFELLWLECKQDHYQRMSDEDTDRLRMLRARKASLLPPKTASGT